MLDRRPGLLLIGLAFPVLRLVDAAIGLAAIPIAWFSASTGRWKSPARRVIPADQPDPEALAPADEPALAELPHIMASWPPSMTRPVPWMNDASSEARNA